MDGEDYLRLELLNNVMMDKQEIAAATDFESSLLGEVWARYETASKRA